MGQRKRPLNLIARGAIITSAILGLTPVAAFASDPCDGALSETQEAATQRREQCAAKKAAEKAATNDKISGGLWTAVAGVCAVSCFKADWGDGGAWCKYSNWGGIAADIGLSQDVAASITSSLPSLAVSFMMEDGTKEATKETAKTTSQQGTQQGAQQGTQAGAQEGAKSEYNKASCATAVLAAAKAFQKFSSAKNQEDLAKKSGENAEALRTHSGTTVAAGGNGGFGGTTGTGGTNGVASGSPAGSGSSSSSTANDSCSRAQGSNNADTHINCAVAGDPSLAPVMDPKFKKEFEKSAGKTLGDFLADASKGSPEGNMLSAMSSAGLSGAQMKSAAAAFKKTKDSLNYDVQGATLASRGGGGGSGTSEGDDMAQLMAGLMGQLMPQEGEEKLPPGFTVMDFKSLTRSPAAVAEDRSINIFQRVSFRYHYVGRRVLSGRP